jgi:hypothetical protein
MFWVNDTEVGLLAVNIIFHCHVFRPWNSVITKTILLLQRLFCYYKDYSVIITKTTQRLRDNLEIAGVMVIWNMPVVWGLTGG